MLDAYLRSAAAKRRAEEQKRMQAQREAQRAYEKFLKDQEAAQRKAAAEAERAEKAKVRQREAEARKHEAAQRRAEAERDRLAKARERERRQLAAEAERAAARRLVEEKIAEADRRTREVADFMDALEHVLSSRATGGRLHRSTAEAAFTARGPDGLVSVLTSVMNTSTYPAGIFARIVAAEFRPESAELLAACDLPRMDILPTARTYRYVNSRNTTLIEPQPAAELQDAYRRLLARLVLRSLAELFDVCPEGLVASISLNAFVPTKDKATGQPTRPLLISVNAKEASSAGSRWTNQNSTRSCACARR